MLQEVAFTCSSCDRIELYWQDSYKLHYPDCTKCKGPMDYVRKPSTNDRSVTGCYTTPIEMFSCGLIPGELKAFKKANREIDLTDQGVPIARTRQQKKQVLEYFGFQENN